MYDWEGKRVSAADLEKTLESIKQPWEVFAILPAADDSGSLSAHFFLIIARRPK
jgi:hypothetical protein